MTTPKGVGYIMSDDSVTIYFDGVHTITRKAAKHRWDALVASIRASDWNVTLRIVDAIAAAQAYVSGTDIKIVNREFLFNGQKLHTTLTDKIINMMDQDLPIDGMIRFLRNLMQNPSSRAVNELYQFMEQSNLPISDDGYLLAYKRIKKDWTDCHTGKINNRVGCEVSMERNAVDDDPNSDCSHGLHFCSLSYLHSFPGKRLILIKIHPADVVSIPRGYKNNKGRCCKYTVIRELNLNAFIHGNADAAWKAVISDLCTMDPKFLAEPEEKPEEYGEAESDCDNCDDDDDNGWT